VLKEFFKTMIWPILFGIGQIFICGIFILINYLTVNISNEIFLDNMMMIIVIAECLLFIPLFCFLYKNYKGKPKYCSYKKIILLSFFSIFLSIGLNYIIIKLKQLFGLNLICDSINMNIILSTGVIGPIIEELLYRGIVYGSMKTYMSDKIAFYLSVCVFAFSHVGDLFQIIFAFVVGLYLTAIYRKYNNIYLVMFFHILVNVSSILVSCYLI